jgi:hypothetical protein
MLSGLKKFMASAAKIAVPLRAVSHTNTIPVSPVPLSYTVMARGFPG